MIKIQFDHQIFSMQRFGGISRYFASIQDSLAQNKEFSFRDGILHTNNHYVKDRSHPLPNWIGKHFLAKPRRREKWNKRYSKLEIKKNDFDLFHPTYYNPYFLRKLNKPFVLTVHDMIHELMPECFPHYDDTMHLKRVLIEKADHFIAISQSTSDDLQRLYGVPGNKISIIHHGFYDSETDENYAVPFKDYLLFVGERSGYKNFFRLLEAVAPVLIQNNFHLICAGSKPFSRAELETMLRLKIDALVHQLPATDGQLNQLYKNARAFVYPSLYEGFGLPILEAFHNNCPAVVSHTNCFKEVGGDAVAYFDPYDTQSITSTIQTLISNTAQGDILRGKGKVQLQNFPLSACMQKTLDVYRSLI